MRILVFCVIGNFVSITQKTLREDRTTRGDEIYSYAIRSCAKVCVKRTLCSIKDNKTNNIPSAYTLS